MVKINQSRTKGFTLVEILLTAGILSLILYLGFSMDISYFKNNKLLSEQKLLVAILSKARNESQNNMGGVAHGVCFINGAYAAFQGNECTASNSNVMPADKELSELSDFETEFPIVVFSQLSGTTTESLIHLTDGTKSADIIINNEGTIIW